jgi:hypothetical protein
MDSTRQGLIEQIAERHVQTYLDEFSKNVVEDVHLDIDELYQSSIYPEHELILVRHRDLGFVGKEKVLGQTLPAKRIICIDRSVASPALDKRSSFTYAHEFGHGILHSGKKKLYRSGDRHQLSGPGVSRHEIEANQFAAALLMPRVLVHLLFRWTFDCEPPLYYKGPGLYTVCARGRDHQAVVKSYSDYCLAYAGFMNTRFFSVSKTSLALRLSNLGMLRTTKDEIFDVNQPTWWYQAKLDSTA